MVVARWFEYLLWRVVMRGHIAVHRSLVDVAANLRVVEDILLDLGIGSLVELVVLSLGGDESSV